MTSELKSQMSIFITYFTKIQVILLVIASFTFVSSLLFQIKEKEKLSIGFLLLTALFVFSFAALLDPFVNLWDERFHALVGKNLMDHPLLPTLYDDPIVNMAYDRWDRYHIWLHKQPFFLWQIALSFKLFGISEFTLRLPDIILGVFMVMVGYRSGKLLVNRWVGYFTGLMILSSIYLIELIAGRQELEHNDFAFLAYISLSIWSLIEYHYSGKKYWIYLIGIFSGVAILCKWLVGLLIYFGWAILRMLQKRRKLQYNKDLLISLGITLLIALPWQIYIFIYYPEEAIKAYELNILHATYPLDGHRGTWWYHFDIFNTLYGPNALLLLIPSFFTLYKGIRDKHLFYSLLSMVIVVYIFFSLVSTKMPSFTIVVALIIFIAFSSLLHYILKFIVKTVKVKRFESFIFGIGIVAIVLFRFDIELLQEKHTHWKKSNHYKQHLEHNKKIFKSLDLPENTVLFNVKGRHYIEAMFYTGLPAYNFIPSKKQHEELISKGRRVAIFHLNDNELPKYLLNDSTVLLIGKEIVYIDF